MGKLYRNGICNLVACGTANPSQSLFLKRNPQAGAPFSRIQKFADRSVEFTLIPDWVSITPKMAPLYQRGWAVQARFLSRRILHFDKFLTWECSETLVTEAYTMELVAQDRVFPSLPKTERTWFGVDKDDKSSVRAWGDMTTIYAKCHLKFQTDKLIALSGMAQS
jgi:hypothetical protein